MLYSLIFLLLLMSYLVLTLWFSTVLPPSSNTVWPWDDGCKKCFRTTPGHFKWHNSSTNSKIRSHAKCVVTFVHEKKNTVDMRHVSWHSEIAPLVAIEGAQKLPPPRSQGLIRDSLRYLWWPFGVCTFLYHHWLLYKALFSSICFCAIRFRSQWQGRPRRRSRAWKEEKLKTTKNKASTTPAATCSCYRGQSGQKI